MNRNAQAVILGLLISLFFSGTALAQTCRVNTGKQNNGCLLYTEVYEYDYVDQKPEFPGGGQSLLNYINDNRNYPEDAYNNGVEGRVTCSFVVNPNGKISNVTVLRGVENTLNNEAIRIISSMPCWSPGKINDKAVPVRVVCAIPFRK